VTRVAALDCGTNSLRLLIADVDGDSLSDVVRRMEVVRLGQGVDETGRFADEALSRTFAVLDDYAKQMSSYGAEATRMVATSATRDVSNREEFIAGVRSRIGVDPEVISGDEEAALSFAGATRELAVGSDLVAPYLVVDIGGGSTEFVLGDEDGPKAARSVNVGCVRMTERHLRDDPPTADQIAAATADIEAAIDEAGETVPLRYAATLVGLAGSVTTVVALALELTDYDPQRIHHARITRDEVHELTTRLLGQTRDERASYSVMHPGRVDVIGGGALVLDTIMRRGGFDSVVASEHDILDGIAFSMG
jgi:exopolyphosphatase/guanosine-5'-triphosphate,3'-diphosphate pyrophosphatase